MDFEPEPPPIPSPVPEIPVGPLWVTLLVPPAVIVLCALLGLLFKKAGGEMIFLAAPVAAGAFILGTFFGFHSLVRRRYCGRSLVFLDCCYVFGQIIVCLVLWIGSCLVFL